MSNGILLVHCDDNKGLVYEITGFFYKKNANVIDLDEHVEKDRKKFFIRLEFVLDGFELKREEIGPKFKEEIADKHNMYWELHFTDYTPKMALFVSKSSHCLYDILARQKGNDFNVDIPLIISNHKHLESVAKSFDVPFQHIEVSGENKKEAEARQLAVLEKHGVDFVVLARYMQILSPEFIDHFPNRIINIHHSFLPAFPGARPYNQAHDRGVKVIGATSHYVTSDLDAGPIIEQEVQRTSHKDAVYELKRKGQDLEKIVLSRAIRYHLNRKILVYDNKTVIFD